ncbi:MAG TPA: ATP-binding protein [Fimbriimonadaceae bacterium]|nr:ATP-binding protein [Fimbriimonadaceae bacterium]
MIALFAIVPLASLLGWAVGWEPLKAVIPGFTPMNPMTAVGLMCLGGSLYASLRQRRKWLVVGWFLAIAAATIAVNRLLATSLGLDRSFDGLLFASKLDEEIRPNRMAFSTAACLLVASGSAAFMLMGRRSQWLAQLFGAVSTMIGLVVVNCYAFEVLAGQAPGKNVPMALNVAGMFVAFGVAIFLMTPKEGFAVPLMEDTFAARLARHLMVSLILVPPVLGWLADYGERAGLYGRGFQQALLITAMGAMFAFNVWLGARVNNQAERLASERVERARLEAERANRAKSSFLSKMSHELRTPLNAILGFSQLLQMGADEEQAVGYADMIHSAGKHLLKLINEILEIARIESGRTTFLCEPVEVLDVASEVAGLTDPLATENGVTVRVDSRAIHDVYVVADRQRMFQIVLNLVSNAIKYNRPDGTVTVSGRTEGDWMVLQVSDTGRGIPEELQPGLFVAFERLGGEHYAGEGTGLGLALSKSLAEGMAGSLELAQSSPKGSTFELRLPLAEAVAEGSDEPIEIGILPVSSAQGSVLVIEDNRANLRFVREALRRRPNLILHTAANGREGLAKLETLRPDVILLDLCLPDISGVTILEDIRSRSHLSEVAVFVLTADATEAQRQRAEAIGVEGYLTKPLDVRQLLNAIDRSLSLSDAA